MKKLLTILLILGVLAAALWLPTPAQPPATEDIPQLVVGFVELLSESPWRDMVSQSIQSAAEAQNIQLITLECERTQESQIQAIRTLIAYQVDAIVFSPVVMSGWDNVLGETKAAGIPVILTERRVASGVEGAVAAYVGSDYEQQGRMAAHYILREFQGLYRPVRIMELTGTVGSSSSTERSRGIRESLGTSGKFDIFYSLSCDLMFSKAKETMDIYLMNNTRPDVLICYNDAMAFGAIEAMEARAIRPGRDILIISFDAQQQAMDYLQQGVINCEIETNPHVGAFIMEVAAAIGAEGRPYEMQEILLPEEVFTAERSLGELPPRGY